jgi:hypothetical protein
LDSPAIAPPHAAGVTIHAKSWTSTNRGRFPKQAVTLDLEAAQATCPAGQRTALVAGATTVLSR